MTSVIISSTTKLFVDDTSLFSVVNDVNLSEFHLNSDLKKYLNLLINGKCLSILIFLSRLKKLYFSQKLLKHLILQSFFYDIPVARCSTRKDLGMYLDEKLNFGRHITEKIRSSKGISLIKTLHNFLSRRTLLTIYKCFIRSNLDYGHFIYDQPNNQTKQF